ncbi:MAG: hypothetical protein KBT03_11470 [Bacteroidales bacterium]|nr:hypothetical protein [Candidatus Scybalousia scybalohippi]
MEDILELELEQDDEILELNINDELPNVVKFSNLSGNPRDNLKLANELDLTKTNAVQESKQWVNSQNYQNENQVDSKIANAKSQIDGELENKVDKVEGMGLSQNSFTNANKQKLDGLHNYDDTEVMRLIGNLQTAINNINTLLGNVPDGYSFLIVKKGQ